MFKTDLYDSVIDKNDDKLRTQTNAGIKLRTDMGRIPLFEKTDLFATSSSSVNEGLDNPIRLHAADETIRRIDEESIRYQYAAGAFRGARNLARMKNTSNVVFNSRRHRQMKIDNDHYLNMASAARFGLHATNEFSNTVVRSQRPVTTGSTNKVRAYGFEQMNNPTIFPELPFGIPFSTEPNVPNSDVNRHNDVAVDQVPVYAIAGF